MAPLEPAEQLELYEVNSSWFHFFKEVVHGGDWATMSSPAKAIYPVIKAFANPQTGYTVPNYALLKRYSGVASKTSISKAVEELHGKGYLIAIKKAGKPTIYKCREQFNVKDETGNVVAKTAFDYIPKIANLAQIELQNFVRQNLQGDGKLQYIHIEHLSVHIAGDIVGHQENNSTRNIFLPPEQYLQGMKDLLAGKETIESRIVEDTLNRHVDNS